MEFPRRIASSIAPDEPERLQTGFQQLDVLLGGGWPRGVLIELLVERQGFAELGILLPALTTTTPESSRHQPGQVIVPAPDTAPWIMWIAPPWIPYAPGLANQGLALSKLLVTHVQPSSRVVWAMEEALRSRSCAAVFAWADAVRWLALQRLHLLATRGKSWAVMIRSMHFREERSPAVLRLLLRQRPEGVQVEIFKNRFGGVGQILLQRQGSAA